jgi:predicted metal-dependent peptidase
MNKTLQTKLDAAWVELLSRDPFCAAVLMNCRQIIDEDGKVTPTMATDGETLWLNPSMLAAESVPALATVLSHEAMHIVSLHPFRQGARDGKQWNIACDKEINGTLRAIDADGKVKYHWPKCGAVFPGPGEDGKAAEQLCAAPENKPEGNGGDSDEPGDGMGGVRAPSGDASELAEKEARAKMQIAAAAELAKGQGKLPSALARLVNEALNPKVPWQDVLRAFVREAAKDDYSWTRPNPRYAASGFILPSLHSQRLGVIAVAIDTSGSIYESLLNTFLSEVEAIAHECRPECIRLIDCDCVVNSIRDCDPTEPLPRDFSGGGGTAFAPVMDALADEPPVCLLYFTDLDGPACAEPAWPTIWVTNSERTAPFGTTIRL